MIIKSCFKPFAWILLWFGIFVLGIEFIVRINGYEKGTLLIQYEQQALSQSGLFGTFEEFIIEQDVL